MKKLWLLLCCLLFVFAAAACAADVEEGEQLGVVPDDYEWEATPADLLEGEAVVDPHDTAENEQFVEEVSEAEALLGTTIVLPQEFEVSRMLIVDGTYVQVEFVLAGVDYLGRWASGLHENMSGMTDGFLHDENVEINGLSVRLRWTESSEAVGFTSSLGVVDTYDAARNISFMLVQNEEATQDSLTAVAEDFINAIGAEHPAEEPAEDPAEEPAAEGGAGDAE